MSLNINKYENVDKNQKFSHKEVSMFFDLFEL